MLTYEVYQNKNGKNEKAYGKWYARTVQSEQYDLDKLAKHMSNHNTPFSAGTIKGILTDMVNCIIELAMDGKSVKIPNLGIFWIGLQTRPASTKEAFDKKNIENVRLRCRPTGDARPIVLNVDRQVSEARPYGLETADGSSSGGSTSGGSGSEVAP